VIWPRIAVAIVIAVAGCRHDGRSPTTPAADANDTTSCPAPTAQSEVRVSVTGEIADRAVATAVATALCSRLDELACCIAIARGDGPEEQGTIRLVLGVATQQAVTPLTLIGGTLVDRFRTCVTDTIELTRTGWTSPVMFTIHVVAPKMVTAPAYPLSPTFVRSRIRDHFPHFRECYERGREVWPGLAGKVTARLTIGPAGAVTDAEILESGTTIDDLTVRTCIVAEYGRIYFPRPAGGEMSATYGIEFSHDGINARLREG
jgi:hypothetical protein